MTAETAPSPDLGQIIEPLAPLAVDIDSLAALDGNPRRGDVDAVRSALGSAGVLSTPRGLAALVLAQRLDAADSESGAGLAAVARQLDALVAAALGSTDGLDPVDELRIRRRATLAALRATAAERRAKRDAALTRGAS